MIFQQKFLLQRNNFITGEKIKFRIKKNIIYFILNTDKTIDIIICDETIKITEQNGYSYNKLEKPIKIGKINKLEMEGMFTIEAFSYSFVIKKKLQEYIIMQTMKK